MVLSYGKLIKNLLHGDYTSVGESSPQGSRSAEKFLGTGRTTCLSGFGGLSVVWPCLAENAVFPKVLRSSVFDAMLTLRMTCRLPAVNRKISEFNDHIEL